MYAQDNNSLPVWIFLSPAHHHISIKAQPFLVGIVSPKDGSFPIIWDSGASISVMNDKADFLTFTKVSPRHNNVMGVAQGLKFSRFSEVLWSFLDKKGSLRSFKLPALYIPSATTRTSLLQSYSGELIQQTRRGMRLSSTSDGQQNAVKATINPNNNLPTSTGYSYSKVMVAANTLINTMSTTAATNTNLGPAEKELLRWRNALVTLACGKSSSSCKLEYWPPLRPPNTYTPPLPS